MDLLSIQPMVKTLVVKHPATGAPVGLEIDYRSIDAQEVQTVERQLRERNLRSGRNTMTVEKMENDEYTILHSTLAAWRWTGDITLGGEKNPPLTRVNSEKLFRSAAWIRKQLDEAMSDQSGFFTMPSGTSPE